MKTINRLAVLSLLLVYFLIFIGSFVRSTGAGMGCPDWPKCFERFIPPLSESELPVDYADKLLDKRIQKNKKVAKFLSFIGVDVKTSQHVEEKIFFNVKKAWIEYLNRIVGVLVGFSILLFFVFTFLNSKDFKLRVLSSSSLFLVLFQGWIGSLVVSTNLIPGMISIHMLLAMVQCFILIYTLHYLNNKALYTGNNFTVKFYIAFLIFASLIQIYFGIQIREFVDKVLKSIGFVNQQTLDSVGFVFLFHRSYSLFILVVNILVVYYLFRLKIIYPFYVDRLLILCIVFSVLSGAGFYYLDYPFILQPFHLLLSNIIIGIQFYLFLLLSSKKNNSIHVFN